MTVPTMHKVVNEMADYVTRSGFEVDYSRIMGWVAIHDIEENDDTFFLEEEEADQFIDAARAKAEEAEVDVDTALLAAAKPYIDCL